MAPRHIAIEAENYQALQFLNSIYTQQIDCIYIDPPYNSGAYKSLSANERKYNDRFVDPSDSYSRSKWLSMMQTRLQTAAGLLRPDGVLIITIDEHEVHHLAVLLEQMFPDATHQTVTMIINPKGSHRRATFNRVNEYALFVFFDSTASSLVCRMADDLLTGDTNTSNQPVEQTKVRWPYLLHSGYGSLPHEAPGQVYPIAVDQQGRILATGRTLLERADAGEIADHPDALDSYVPPAEELIQLGTETVWPVNRAGELSCWNLRPATLMERVEQGYVSATRTRKDGWAIKYLSTGLIAQIKSGDIKISGNDPVTGSVILEQTLFKKKPMTVWHRSRHDAGRHGTEMVKALLGDKRFNYPKSLYSTLDAIACVMSDRKNAVVLDFFAGSGTTLHAVAALNASDGGRRQCVLVSNNEVPQKEAEHLRDNSFAPGEPEWDVRGIFRNVLMPRTSAAITGTRPDGEPVQGKYLPPLYERPLSEGLPCAVDYFRLTARHNEH